MHITKKEKRKHKSNEENVHKCIFEKYVDQHDIYAIHNEKLKPLKLSIMKNDDHLKDLINVFLFFYKNKRKKNNTSRCFHVNMSQPCTLG
jgi:hypothetical protein